MSINNILSNNALTMTHHLNRAEGTLLTTLARTVYKTLTVLVENSITVLRSLLVSLVSFS